MRTNNQHIHFNSAAIPAWFRALNIENSLPRGKGHSCIFSFSILKSAIWAEISE